MENIELSEMLGQLREELLKARGQSEGSELKFQIEDIEIELQIVTAKAAGAKSGLKFWVVNAEANANVSQAKTQKLKLKLKPVGRDGKGEVLVSDSDRRD